MLYCKDVETFVSANQYEIRKLASSICIRYNVSEVDDVVQDFYYQLIHRNLLEKYNPNHPSATKISTYLYNPLENIVKAHRNSENDFEFKRVGACPFPESYPYEEENQEERKSSSARKSSIRKSNIINVDFENNSQRNGITDSFDGINLDLNLFECYLEEKNKTYRLTRRKPRAEKPVIAAGNRLLPKSRFLPFGEARAYAGSLRLETHEDWRMLCRSGNRPSNIPADPRRTYAKSGWNGWRDFFWGAVAESTKGLDLLTVFRLMREGHTNREIALKYGVSDMWITIVKREIKGMLVKFGIVWNNNEEKGL